MPDPLGDFSYTWPFYAALLTGYLAGSIPFGLILTRMAGTEDIRKIGSGSIGATNVLRTGRKSLAAATVLLDAAKGAVPVLVADMYGPDMVVLAAAGAVLGHCFPVWLKFKGGKAVATAAGVLLALDPLLGLACFGVWLAVVLITRISSAGALAALLAAPFITYHMMNLQFAELVGAIALLIAIRHHQNIRRLIKGTEPRISFSKK